MKPIETKKKKNSNISIFFAKIIIVMPFDPIQTVRHSGTARLALCTAGQGQRDKNALNVNFGEKKKGVILINCKYNTY